MRQPNEGINETWLALTNGLFHTGTVGYLFSLMGATLKKKRTGISRPL